MDDESNRLEQQIAFTTHLIDKKDELSRSVDAKVGAYITLNSILIGGLFLILPTLLDDKQPFGTMHRVKAGLLIIAFVCFVLSLFISIRRVRIILHVENTPDSVRTLETVHGLETEKFEEWIAGMGRERILKENCIWVLVYRVVELSERHQSST